MVINLGLILVKIRRSLLLIEVKIATFEGHQFGVGSLLNDRPIIHHDNEIGTLNGTETVGNKENVVFTENFAYI